jgi:glycosyltransferase 2 family protein
MIRPSLRDPNSTVPQPPRGRALFGWLMKVAFSTAVIAILASNLNSSRVVESLLAADGRLVIAAFAAVAITPLLTAERWRHAALSSHVLLSRSFFVRALYAAVFAGQFLPAGIGIDAARVAMLWRQQVPLRTALASVVLDRLAGISAIFLLVVTGYPFAVNLLPSSTVYPIITAVFAFFVGCTAALFVDRVPLPARLRRGRLKSLLMMAADLRTAARTQHALVALTYGVALHVLSILSVLLLSEAFGYQLQFRELLFVVSVAIFAALLPISFNGWGVREGAMILALSLLGVSRESALAISLLFGVASAIASLPGSVSWYRLRYPHNAAPHVAPPLPGQRR